MDTAVKSERLLRIYSRLAEGEVLRKRELAQRFHVTERSIQRDMESLRAFCAGQGLRREIVYDRGAGGYRLEGSAGALLSNSEILAVCKILLESRSMRRDEMLPVLDKLVACCVPEESKRAVADLLANEKYHYIEPHHGRPILPGLWELGQAVLDRLPTAKVVEKGEDGCIIEAEVFGKGIEMWLKSQGEYVTMLKGDAVEGKA